MQWCLGLAMGGTRTGALQSGEQDQVMRKLIVLDLDETLIFGTSGRESGSPDFVVGEYAIYQRPHLREFLDFCLAEFEVAIWTSATEQYAAEIVPKLFGAESKELVFIWARARCTLEFDHHSFAYLYTKNLKKVERLGYPAERVVVVDNSPEKWKRSYGNLVQVADFEGDSADHELADLMDYLAYLKGVDNVRAVEKRGWRARSNRRQG